MKITLIDWVAEVGGATGQLIQMRKYSSGIFGLIKTGNQTKWIKIPERVGITFMEFQMVGRGPIAKIKPPKKALMEPYPYWPAVSCGD